MFELEPWMVRTAAVIAFLCLVDVWLYVLSVRVERRRSMRSRRGVVDHFGRLDDGRHDSATA
jgi:hypothetical protein